MGHLCQSLKFFFIVFSFLSFKMFCFFIHRMIYFTYLSVKGFFGGRGVVFKVEIHVCPHKYLNKSLGNRALELVGFTDSL